MIYFVYIMTNRPYGTLYIGVTNHLARRVSEHKSGVIEGFTKRYKLDRLVYYEAFDRIADAIAHEKRLKRWNRAWKGGANRTVESQLGGPAISVVPD